MRSILNYLRRLKGIKYSSDTSGQAPLGYHLPGAFHYFTQFTENMTWLGSRADQSFTSHTSFGALVTAAHEYHHFLQEMLQGFSWWRANVQDDLSVHISALVNELEPHSTLFFPLWDRTNEPILRRGTESALDAAKMLAVDLKMIDDWAVSSETTANYLALETAKYPDFEKMLNEDFYALTTLDLAECHAALLTELFVSKMAVETPARFNSAVVSDFEPVFRLSQMAKNYGRPFRVVTRIFEYWGLSQLLTFSKPVHPMYDRVKYGQLYLLTAFLLDYALHLPPNARSLFEAHKEPTTVFDLHPPLRFISLALLLVVEVATNRHGWRNKMLTESRLYEDADPALANLINETRAVERRSSVKYSDRRDVPNTFASMRDVTQQWQSQWQRSKIRGRFKEIDDLRIRCVGFRQSHPDSWFKLDPHGVGTTLKIPQTAATSEGVNILPYISDPGISNKDELEKYLKAMIERALNAQVQGQWESEEVADLPSTLFPWRFVIESTEYEMFQSFGRMVLDQGCMRCPLTIGIGRVVRCENRTRQCERIDDPRTLPKQNCRLRSLIEQYFGKAERFIPKGRPNA
jgi:hypothetical protein